ncbi:MAG: hypothetical protein ACXAEU_19085 [Candidatus Hodarchaeales archaeon]
MSELRDGDDVTINDIIEVIKETVTLEMLDDQELEQLLKQLIIDSPDFS